MQYASNNIDVSARVPDQLPTPCLVNRRLHFKTYGSAMLIPENEWTINGHDGCSNHHRGALRCKPYFGPL